MCVRFKQQNIIISNGEKQESERNQEEKKILKTKEKKLKVFFFQLN